MVIFWLNYTLCRYHEDAQRAVTFLFEYAEIQCSVSCRMSTVAVSTVWLDSYKLAARFTIQLSTELYINWTAWQADSNSKWTNMYTIQH